MLFESLSWVMLTLTLLVALPGAFASTTPKRTKKSSVVEIYPAMEDGEIEAPPRAEIPPSAAGNSVALAQTTTVSTKKNRRVQTLGAPAPVSAPLSAPAAYVSTQPAKTPTEFEVVPAEKRFQILKRMHLCESLFQATGRAYDYRTMTTAQLQKEMNAVQAGTRPVATGNSDASLERDPILDSEE
jgi:hypothetical protein